MRCLKPIIVIVLFVLAAFIIYDYTNRKWKITNEQLKEWQDAYARLADSRDSLDLAYALLKEEFQQMDSLYKKRLQINIMQYEKDMAAFDTLTVDEHIQLLSDYLSKEDSIPR